VDYRPDKTVRRAGLWEGATVASVVIEKSPSLFQQAPQGDFSI